MLFRGLLGTAYSGKLDGLVASHCHGSKYFRAHSIPTNPNTTRQQQLRTCVQTQMALWQGLDEGVRNGWEAWAALHRRRNALGDAGSRTGQNEYIRWAVPRQFCNDVLGFALGIGDAYPTGAEAWLGTHPTAEVITAGDQLQLTFDNTDWWVNDQDNALLLWVGAERGAADPPKVRPLPPTVNYFRGPWVLLGAIAGDPDDPISPTLTVDLSPSCPIGHRIAWKVRLTTDNNGYSAEYYGSAVRAP